MPKVTYLEHDGTVRTVEAEPGLSLMEIAVKNAVEGIVAICGGSCSCGTCQVYVDEAWMPLVGEASEDEQQLLEFAEHPSPTLRLACQIPMRAELDGLVVRVPKDQH